MREPFRKYIPGSRVGGSAPGSVGDGSLTDEQLDALNVALRERYNRDGDGWITTTVLGGRRVLRATS